MKAKHLFVGGPWDGRVEEIDYPAQGYEADIPPHAWQVVYRVSDDTSARATYFRALFAISQSAAMYIYVPSSKFGTPEDVWRALAKAAGLRLKGRSQW